MPRPMRRSRRRSTRRASLEPEAPALRAARVYFPPLVLECPAASANPKEYFRDEANSARASILGLERAQVGGDRHHVLDRELRDHRLHQLGERTGAIAVLHVVQLANDVDRRAAGGAPDLAPPLPRRAAGEGAGGRLPPPPPPPPPPGPPGAPRPRASEAR